MAANGCATAPTREGITYTRLQAYALVLYEKDRALRYVLFDGSQKLGVFPPRAFECATSILKVPRMKFLKIEHHISLFFAGFDAFI